MITRRMGDRPSTSVKVARRERDGGRLSRVMRCGGQVRRDEGFAGLSTHPMTVNIAPIEPTKQVGLAQEVL